MSRLEKLPVGPEGNLESVLVAAVKGERRLLDEEKKKKKREKKDRSSLKEEEYSCVWLRANTRRGHESFGTPRIELGGRIIQEEARSIRKREIMDEEKRKRDTASRELSMVKRHASKLNGTAAVSTVATFFFIFFYKKAFIQV